MPVAPNINPTLATRLRAWRKSRGITQTAASLELSTPYRTYADWEAGIAEPTGFGKAKLIELLEAHERQCSTL